MGRRGGRWIGVPRGGGEISVCGGIEGGGEWRGGWRGGWMEGDGEGVGWDGGKNGARRGRGGQGEEWKRIGG